MQLQLQKFRNAARRQAVARSWLLIRQARAALSTAQNQDRQRNEGTAGPRAWHTGQAWRAGNRSGGLTYGDALRNLHKWTVVNG